METYTKSYEAAVNHCMLYEVGKFWDLNTPGVKEGLINTQAQKIAVGYVNDPRDAGGETKYGIAKNANPDLNLKTLDWEAAKRVYYRRYWLLAHCDVLTTFVPRLAVLHFDIAVNHGAGRAAKFLQEAVGAIIDGDIGPRTLQEVKAAANKDELALCNKICDLRVQFYHSLVANKPEQVKFLKGWLSRAEDLRKFCSTNTFA
jgi:lysozyme family protein